MRKVHMVGIGGIGMSGLAQLLLDRGIEVTGSDREASPVTELLEKKGIRVLLTQVPENVPEDADMVIYTEAAWEDNPERVRAKELDIPEQSYFEALGAVSAGMRTIAVAGTHGKTTTTGMLARVLRDVGVSPTAVVGSLVRDFGSNYLAGTGEWFVVEACEYKRDFLTLSPEILVITNIEFDHTDYYKDLADVQAAFRALAEKVPAHGVVVTDLGNPNIMPVVAGLAACVVDYTTEPTYALRLPGAFNTMNAQAAAAASRLVSPETSNEDVAVALAAFEGTWRRFEYKGTTRTGAELYDDYAHHPTAIRKTLVELRKKTEGRVFVAFHPHLYSRTRDLLDEFATAFVDADEVIIAPIYPAREVDDGTISNAILADRIRETGTHARSGTFEEIARILATEPAQGDTVMLMGAGDIYKIAEQLV